MKKGDDTRRTIKSSPRCPGKVVKIPVQKGDHLQAGDIVIVLESNENAKQLQGELGMYRQRHSGERRRFGKRKSDIDFIGNHK